MPTGAIGKAPQSYTWTFPICPHRVSVDLSAVRVLQHDVSASQEPQQGVLLGYLRPGLTHIRACEPIERLDADSLSAAIAKARLEVVGYYRIRDGCAFILDPAEIDLAKAAFPEPGCVVLLIERRESGAAEGTFSFWRGEAFVSNLPHSFPIDAEALAREPQPPALVIEEDERRPGLLRRHAGPIGLLIASVLAVVILPLMWMNSQPPPERAAVSSAAPLPVSAPAPTVTVVARQHGDIEIAWDRQAVASATGGLLKIEDGGVRHHVPLDAVQLRHGSIVYSPGGAGPVSAELKILGPDGQLDEVAVSARPARPAPPPQPAAAPKQVEASVVPVRDTRPAPAPAAKRFEPVVETRRAPAPSAALLPDAPSVHNPVAAAPLLNAALPTPPPEPIAPSSPRVRLGPPIERVTPSLEHVGEKAGRMIWTGTLLRRGVVEFDGRSASIGSLNGALPGVPVHVTVLPAEFGNDGLVVYTTDARMHNRVEAPSAANGWNRITYIWDPERVRQIAVLETPNPSNRFSHLALRSDARRCSMLVIDWTAR